MTNNLWYRFQKSKRTDTACHRFKKCNGMKKMWSQTQNEELKNKQVMLYQWSWWPRCACMPGGTGTTGQGRETSPWRRSGTQGGISGTPPCTHCTSSQHWTRWIQSVNRRHTTLFLYTSLFHTLWTPYETSSNNRLHVFFYFGHASHHLFVV